MPIMYEFLPLPNMLLVYAIIIPVKASAKRGT
jgi:hypothetical protein